MTYPTQKDRVLTALKAGPTCGTVFLKMHIPRYSARVYDLRADGWWIVKRRCRDGRHGHQSRQFLFELVGRDR